MSHSINDAADQLLALAAERRGAALEELEKNIYQNTEKWDREEAYDIANSFGQASLLCADAEHFCRLADALQGDDRDAVFHIWNQMDTDPREAVAAQAPAAHEIIAFYASEDEG